MFIVTSPGSTLAIRASSGYISLILATMEFTELPAALSRASLVELPDPL